MLSYYLLGVLKMTIFGFLKSNIFIFFEEELHSYLKQFSFLDEISRPVFIGGIAAAFAILVASYLKHKYFAHLNMIRHPFVDFIGVLIGTVIAIVCYNVIIKHNLKKNKDNKGNKGNFMVNRGFGG